MDSYWSKVAWFSDETLFHLDHYINKPNAPFWVTEDPGLPVAINCIQRELNVVCVIVCLAPGFGVSGCRTFDLPHQVS